MKSSIALACIFFAFACIAQSIAMPYPDPAPHSESETAVAANLADAAADELAVHAAHEDHVNTRHKRVTCDLLSSTGVNHSACAAHCLMRGNRGGYCNGQAVCVCRN